MRTTRPAPLRTTEGAPAVRPEGPNVSLLTTDKLAEEWDTTPRHVRNLMYFHGLPYVKVGHLVRFDKAEVDAWLAARRKVKP